MAYIDNIQAARDSLSLEYANELAYRAANGPKPTYTVKGKQVDWSKYQAQMLLDLRELNALVLAAGGDGGLYEEVTRGYT